MNKLIVKSKGGLLPHTHTLEIPMDEIQHPTKSITIEASKAYALIYRHSHPVTITKEQLLEIKSGKVVVVKDDNTKRHTFEIKF